MSEILLLVVLVALVQIDCKMAQLEVTRASTRSVLGDSWSVTELAGVLVESLERVLLLLLLCCVVRWGARWGAAIVVGDLFGIGAKVGMSSCEVRRRE